MAKEKRATWWKMFYHQRAAIESVGDEDAGAGLKAAFRYFDGEDIPPESLTPQAFTVFCVIRPYIDESFQDYNSCVESGKQGARNRWGKDSPPIGSHSPPMGCLREAEADILLPKGNRESRAEKPPHHRFIPPTADEVRKYCQERHSSVDPIAFVSFYESKGWMVGKNKMRSWKSAISSWERRDKAERKGGAEDDHWA